MGRISLKARIFNNFIKILPPIYLEGMFYRIGRLLDVRSFTYGGELGLFEGSIYDDTVQRYYLRNGTWAKCLQYLVRTLFANGPGTLIDVGANIGLTTIPISKANGNIDLYAFEPEPNNYLFLRKNIIANDVEAKIKTFNFALYSENCTLEMELSGDNMGDHRLRRRSNANFKDNYSLNLARPTVKIQARTLDSVLHGPDLVKPIILKVDTQGAEVQVFSGASNLLSEVDYLIVEYWPEGLRRMGDTTDSFLDIIRHFSWGAVYDDEVPALPTLLPIGEFIASMDSLLDKSDHDQLDLILSRQPIPRG